MKPDRDIFGRVSKDKPDWSHRRGEPRWFALAWTMFVLATTLTAIFSAGTPDLGSRLAYAEASKHLMVVLGVGVGLLWPMIRLSQASPAGGLRGSCGAALRDVVIVLTPLVAVILPHFLLARWPVPVVLAVACSFAAWTLLVGAMLAIAIRERGARSFGASVSWMLAFVALVAGVPAVVGLVVAVQPAAISVRSSASIEWWWLGSPATSAVEMVRPRAWTGASTAVVGGHWVGIAVVASCAVALWIGAIAAGHANGAAVVAEASESA
ncbi:MAG: hypothetical protein AAF747_09105 [Planctomycetota bacterium]